MPKPRIFIAMHYMHLGGAESALLGLLQSLDAERVDIDLFIYSHEGELMKYIPKYVNLLPENTTWSMFEKPLKFVIYKGYWRMAYARLKTKLGFGNLQDNVSRILPDLYSCGKYDLAISFLTPHKFIYDHVTAKKKVCWIHTDYTNMQVNADAELPIWSKYDNIVSISPDVTKTFLKVFPSLENKIIEIENILTPSFVRSRADEFEVQWPGRGDHKNPVILTIGRFTEQKNFDNLPMISSLMKKHLIKLLSVGRFNTAKKYDNLPDICRRLNASNCNVIWYIIGYGMDEQLIRAKIVEAGMQDNVIILGKKENPYPYIKACDIYVQPSRYEGKSVTVREAQMLCKPVVVTNYPTASSQIKDGEDGVIVPLDNQGCAEGLAKFILDESKQRLIEEYLQTHDYGNVKEVEKIYSLLRL